MAWQGSKVQGDLSNIMQTKTRKTEARVNAHMEVTSNTRQVRKAPQLHMHMHALLK